MARASESADVDTAYSTLQTNVITWLDAGGNADLFVRWIVARLAGADERLGRKFKTSLGIDPIQRHGLNKTLASADVRS